MGTLNIQHSTFNIQHPGKIESARGLAHSRTQARKDVSSAFTLVEVMVAMGILGLIVLVLMTVFSNTQAAFRASVTSSDILENGRATMELMTADLRSMAPSDGFSQGNNNALGANGMAFNNEPVNFFVTNNSAFYQPLVQPLIGSANGATRTNLLEYFFMLGRQNTSWVGIGYIVNTHTSPSLSLYPLYRFSAQTNIQSSPSTLFNLFQSEILSDQWTNMSHLMDGVVGLTVRAYDTNGVWLTNGYYSLTNLTLRNTWFTPQYPAPPLPGGQVGYAFFSNALPASVEIEMATLEDRSMQRAESLGVPGGPQPYYNMTAEWNYLSSRAGAVHIFRQRVTIPQVDPSAYQ
ncbi:MAG TPA: prepilin-type N-terminal cleavage/methylation domain-containing protein [Verrucomicrobiae bacterium]|jgi:prepilin-type N-terminal cleavage/methylation domain-containing protein